MLDSSRDGRACGPRRSLREPLSQGQREVLSQCSTTPGSDGADGIGYGVDYPVFWIDRFHPHGTRQLAAFAARSRAQVDAFHAAALRAGGTDNGKPGLREAQGYPPGYHAAFVLDPDGNNMEAVFRERRGLEATNAAAGAASSG